MQLQKQWLQCAIKQKEEEVIWRLRLLREEGIQVKLFCHLNHVFSFTLIKPFQDKLVHRNSLE